MTGGGLKRPAPELAVPYEPAPEPAPEPEPEPEPVTLDAALVLIERLRADVERLRAELKSTRLSLEIRRAKCKKAAENLGRVEEILKDLESPAVSASPSASVSVSS